MIRFSQVEVKQLTLSFIVVSLVFWIAFGIPFLYSALIVGLGFVLHELGHKFVAQHFNLQAEFRYDLRMLIVSFFVSFLHFVFLAPGAVVIRGRITKEKNGLIALAGPLMNLLLALIFLLIPSPFSKFGVAINAWLAFFNLIPFPGFDGVKVLYWNKLVFALSFISSLFFVFAYHF